MHVLWLEAGIKKSVSRVNTWGGKGKTRWLCTRKGRSTWLCTNIESLFYYLLNIIHSERTRVHIRGCGRVCSIMRLWRKNKRGSSCSLLILMSLLICSAYDVSLEKCRIWQCARTTCNSCTIPVTCHVVGQKLVEHHEVHWFDITYHEKFQEALRCEL